MKRIKVALIICPCWTNLTPPLGIAYLASLTKSKGHEARCFDVNIELSGLLKKKDIDYWGFNEHYRWLEPNFSKQILPSIKRHLDSKTKEILAYDPDIIGFSIFDTNAATSLYLAEQIKNINPAKKIIFGGPECYKEAFNYKFLNTSFVDMVVIGEGEQTLEGIIKSYSETMTFNNIKGTIIRENNMIYANGHRDEIRNLDILPLPDFTDFNLKQYKRFALPIITSRGCVGSCAFCGEIAYWKNFRFRSAENVFEEIKYAVDNYGIRDFFFNDSLINGNLKELSNLADLIIRNEFKIKWGGYARVHKGMSLELLKKLKSAGCLYLSYGIESGSQKVLNIMNKGIILKDAEANLKDTTSAGLQVHVNWIVGFPTESWLDFLKSLNFIYRNRKNIYYFNPGQMPCGVPSDSGLALHPDRFRIANKQFLNEWRTKFFTNTIIQRKLRLKVLRKYISLLEIEHS